jgi:putative FmdB family regulatory protein
MPIYEYQCRKCGCRMEVFQKFSDPPLTQCEECKGKVRKLISRVPST